MTEIRTIEVPDELFETDEDAQAFKDGMRELEPKSRTHKWPFIDMNVGDTILVCVSEIHRARTAAYITGQRHNMQFTSRTTNNGLLVVRVR
jgi:hypothetical protein